MGGDSHAGGRGGEGAVRGQAFLGDQEYRTRGAPPPLSPLPPPREDEEELPNAELLAPECEWAVLERSRTSLKPTSLRQRARTLTSLRRTSKPQEAAGLVTLRSRRRTPTQQAAVGLSASSGQLCLASKRSAFSTAGARPSEPMSWLMLRIQGHPGINFQPRYAIARRKRRDNRRFRGPQFTSTFRSIKQQPAHGSKHSSHFVGARFPRDCGLRFCCKTDQRQEDLCGHGSLNSCFKSFLVCVKEEERSRPKLCENIERHAKSPQNPGTES